jgi:tRNA (cytidine/uridine-2'-O-)-methyltransferase
MRGGGRAGRLWPWGRTKDGDPAAFIGTLIKGVQARKAAKARSCTIVAQILGLSGDSSIDAARLRGETTAMRIALYEPDIPQNTGTILRLAACLGVEAHIIEPTGFPSSDRAFRRAGMDYLDQVALRRHVSWAAFETWRQADGLRLILFTTAATASYLDHAYRPGDVLMFGRESAGVPDAVHRAADARLLVPMRPGLRSINVAMVAAMALGEATRQTGGIRRD